MTIDWLREGDVVDYHGVRGVVQWSDGKTVRVAFGVHVEHFSADGRFHTWAGPVLKLIERPARKVMRKGWVMVSSDPNIRRGGTDHCGNEVVANSCSWVWKNKPNEEHYPAWTAVAIEFEDTE